MEQLQALFTSEHPFVDLLPLSEEIKKLFAVFCGFSHNRPFAASHSRGKKPPRWRAKVALGQDKQKTYIILNGNFLCLSCPSVTFALQHGGFVPREWLAAN